MHTCSGRLEASQDLTVEVGVHEKLASKSQSRHLEPLDQAMLNTEGE